MWLRWLDPQVASQQGPAPLAVGQRENQEASSHPSRSGRFQPELSEQELGAPSSGPAQGAGAPSPAVCWASAALGEGAHFPEGPEAWEGQVAKASRWRGGGAQGRRAGPGRSDPPAQQMGKWG